jgi:hypothetical protein
MIATPIAHPIVLTVVNTTTILFSFQPHISKWWWIGAILNTFFFLILIEPI